MSFDDNPVIARRRERAHTLKVIIEQKAEATYATFDNDERTVLQFGMFPAGKLLAAEKELLAMLVATDGAAFDTSAISRMFAGAIMDCANRGPQKLVV